MQRRAAGGHTIAASQQLLRGRYLRSRNEALALSGNDFKIMYFVIQDDVSDAQYVGAMVGQFGEAKCMQSKTSITLNNEQYAGTRLKVTIAGNSMSMDVIRIGSGKQTRLLVLQDNPDDDGKPLDEGRATLANSEKSFRAE